MKGPLQIYNSMKGFPLGKRLFMGILCFKAPYFGTIRPRMVEYDPGKCVISMKKRRAVENHLGTVHAIAMCNMCELTAGLCLESVIPDDFRWIAKSMDIRYLLKGESDLVSTSSIVDIEWRDRMDLSVPVDIRDRSGRQVAAAVVMMYVSRRKDR